MSEGQNKVLELKDGSQIQVTIINSNEKPKPKRTRNLRRIVSKETYQEKTKDVDIFKCGGVFYHSGLNHIGENIFRYLHVLKLFQCRLVCQSWNYLLQNPMFWIKYKSDLVKNNLHFEQWKWERDEWLKVVSNLNKAKSCPDTFGKIAEKVGTEVLNSGALEYEMSLSLSKRMNRIRYDIKNFSPMHVASQYGMVKLADFLVLIDGSMNYKDLRYIDKDLKTKNWIPMKTPIEIAASRGQFAIVKKLFPEMNEPMKPSSSGWGLIHYASHNDRVEILKFLEAYIETPIGHLQYPNGTSLLKGAVINGQINTLKYLYENTAKPNDPLPGNSSMTLYEYAIVRGHLKSVEFLAKKMDNPMMSITNGLNPLHLAARNDKVEVVKFLLTLTDNPNPYVPHKNQYELRGQTPIFMAAEKGFLDVVKVLCEACIKVSMKNKIFDKYNGWSPFHIAIKNGHLEVVKYLIELMDNPHFNLVDCKIPLQIAIDNEKLEVATFLLQRMGKDAENPDQQKNVFDSLKKRLK